jgi:hypothetical protein
MSFSKTFENRDPYQKEMPKEHWQGLGFDDFQHRRELISRSKADIYKLASWEKNDGTMVGLLALDKKEAPNVTV